MVLRRRREEDPGTGAWTRVVATRLVANRSRFEVDLNRPPEQAVYRRPEDCWGLPVWPEPPALDLVSRSLDEYRRYYEVLDGVLTTLVERFDRVVVFDLHSYNHRRGGPGSAPDDPVANPVVNVGTGNLDRGRWAGVIDRFMADLGSQSLAGVAVDVRENVRFRGGYQSRWIASQYPDTVCVLAVEVKKVYMDEWTGEIDAERSAAVAAALASTRDGLIAALEAVGGG